MSKKNQEGKKMGNLLMQLLDQYGYIVLFLSLMLELIIIPIPNELLMTYVGFLVYQEN
jgi:membrane protein DedA with SNARE-associated domain